VNYISYFNGREETAFFSGVHIIYHLIFSDIGTAVFLVMASFRYILFIISSSISSSNNSSNRSNSSQDRDRWRELVNAVMNLQVP
jgi:hypothetical protein